MRYLCQRCDDEATSYQRQNGNRVFCGDCLETFCLEIRLEEIEKNEKRKMKYGTMFYKSKEALKHLSSKDINAWMEYNYLYNEGKCPGCNQEFFGMHPETDMYPHWKGECKERK